METPLSKPDRIPPAVEIEELLTTLLDLDVEVKTITKVAYKANDVCVLGLFKKEENHLGAVVVGDRYFANFIGASLSRMAADSARRDIKNAMITDTMLENVEEVFTVFANNLNARGAPHLVLHQTRKDTIPLPGPLSKVVDVAPNRIDLQVAIPGYGKGTMTLALF
jgi:hypothetical protein